MSDLKVGIVEGRNDGNIYVQFGNEIKNITDSEQLFVVAYNKSLCENKNSALVVANATTEEEFLKLASLVYSSLLKLKESLGIVKNLTPSAQMCEDIFKDCIKK